MAHSLHLDSDPAPFPDLIPVELSPEIAQPLEQVLQGDRLFFHHHPEALYYVRPITSPEIIEGLSHGQKLDETFKVFVGEVVPGTRIRLPFLDPLAPPIAQFKAIQQRLHQQVGGKTPTLKDRIHAIQPARLKPLGFANKG